MPIMFRKICSSLMIVSMLMISLPMPHAYAAMVGTEQVVQAQSTGHAHDQIMVFLEQAEVQQQLQALGVAPDDAKARVASLTESEMNMLANRIEQLPAGGDVVGTIAGVILIIFLVLLFTDIIGVTDVFSFVN
ncbi:MAG: PA2779 family protein [Mariprofundaceae bacterium]